MDNLRTDEAVVVAAATVYWTKTRLRRISITLDTIQALRLSRLSLSSSIHLSDIEPKERYLIALENNQQLAQHDARQFVIAASRREATTASASGFPVWETYMERLAWYCHVGMTISKVRMSLPMPMPMTPGLQGAPVLTSIACIDSG
jgi:hypothetical protein